MILDVARRDPERLALDDGTRRRSFGELVERAWRVAHLLRDELGVAPEEHVAVLAGNRVEAVELVLGGILAGVWVCPVNWHLTADEIAYVLSDSGARVLFVDPEQGAAAQTADVPVRIEVGEALEAALARADPTPLPLDGPAGGTMTYTSGTTGLPKGVKRARPATLGAALERAAEIGRAYGLDGSGAHLVTGPLYHAAPLLLALYDQANGAPLIILPRWDAEACLDRLEEHGVAHTHMVPTMFVRLLALSAERRARFDPGALTLVLHGAAPISVEVKRAMIDWWGPSITEYWGASEGGIATLATADEWLARPGTVGRAIGWFEVFAVDAAGERLPAGAEGRLVCRHGQLERLFDYHGAPEKTAEAHPRPHEFRTGDLGRVDAEGWVHLTDRESHTIISGGVNVYPAEIENVLIAHPAVADVAVFGVPDAEWGEAVKAVVELEPGHVAGPELERALIGHAGERLARFKLPRSVDFVDELPRTSSGKLYVRRLRDPYWAGRDRRI